MTDALVDWGRDLVPRQPPLLVCLVLFAAFVTVLVGWFAFLLGRFGWVPRWPRFHALGLALVGFAGSICWLWINGPIEGRTILDLTDGHGITDGDLLIAPVLAGAVRALFGQLRYRRVG